mgnify:CR=1 FL=1
MDAISPVETSTGNGTDLEQLVRPITALFARTTFEDAFDDEVWIPWLPMLTIQVAHALPYIQVLSRSAW